MSYWQDKVVLVTGGSAGLGRSIAKAYGAAGAKVMVTARGVKQLKDTTNELTEAGVSVACCTADVTKQSDAQDAVAATIKEFGHIDCLVNNVGRSTRGNALDASPDDFRELLEINFLSVVNCVKAAAPHLLESRGHIVNIGSLASKSVSKYLGAYPASKFAVAAYSQQLRYELNPQGVHVLLVCPGPIARDDAGNRYNEDSKDLPPSASQPGGGIKVKGIHAEQLAKKIIRACERRQSELILPSKARWLFAISQLWPSIGDWIIRRKTS